MVLLKYFIRLMKKVCLDGVCLTRLKDLCASVFSYYCVMTIFLHSSELSFIMHLHFLARRGSSTHSLTIHFTHSACLCLIVCACPVKERCEDVFDYSCHRID